MSRPALAGPLGVGCQVHEKRHRGGESDAEKTWSEGMSVTGHVPVCVQRLVI